MFKKVKLVKFFCIFFALYVEAIKAEFPIDPKPCKFKDSQCIAERINYFLNAKYMGDSSINLLKTDPLTVPIFHLKQDASNPINIDLVMKNSVISGLKDTKVLKVSGFDVDMTKTQKILLNIKQLFITGDYTVRGKVLVLPVNGHGKYELTMDDVTLAIHFNGIPDSRNGKTFMKMENLSGSFMAKKVKFNFENLLNGDKVLSDNMNIFINENWQEVFNEIRSSLINGVAPIFQNIFNEVFSKLPYDEFFVKELLNVN